MCSLTDPGSCIGGAVDAAVGDAIQNLANAVLEMFGTAVSSLGTLWVYIGTPNLTDSGGSSPITAGAAAPNSGNITTILNYVTWIGLVLAAAAMVWLGMLIAASLRRGEGALNVGRLGLVLGGVVMICGAGSLIGRLIPVGPTGASGATLFIQSSLWWYMGALAVLSVIIAGVRMAWENRADPGRDLLRSLITLSVVAGAGVTVTQLLITASDSFSIWVLRGSLQCDVSTDSACFGENILHLMVLGTGPGSGSLGAMLVIVLGLVASLVSFIQIVLMLVRSGMLVILAGILPFSAAATNTEMGKGWFRKCLGWLVAFLLYKPAAAIVYATAFQLIGTDLFRDDDALVAVLTGLMLMVLALVAMPALMRFVTPLVGSLASGAAGGAVAAGAMAALPTGAAAAGRLMSGAGSNAAASGPSSQPGGSSTGGSGGGQDGRSGPSGSDGASGTARVGSQAAPQPSGGANGGGGSALGGGSNRTQASVGAAQGASVGTGGGAAVGTGAAAGSGAAAGGGAAAAGAAAGPVGLAAGAAADGAQRVGDAAKSASAAAQGAAEEATGEGGEPSGSR